MVTAIYAGLLGGIYFYLSIIVIQQRHRSKVSLGAGESEVLEKKIRAHANFSEFVPLILLLATLVELQGGAALIVHSIGASLTLGRGLHAFGIVQTNDVNKFRVVGMALTFTSLLIGSISGLILAVMT